MKIHELNAGAHKDRKRVGRGIAAGQGKTAGRGTKGQKSRAGYSRKATFMGGQGSLMQRIPMARGFKSLRAPAQVVYTGALQTFEGDKATNFTLAEAGLVASPFHSVKIITKGELTKKLTVEVQAASASAQAAIEKAGGSFTKTTVPRLSEAKKQDT